MEIKVTIEAPELAKAINNLAVALCKKSKDEPIKQASETSKEEPHTYYSETVAQPALQPKIQTTVPTVAPSVPVATAPQYTIDQIMKAGASLMDAGKIDELRKLISSFGVEAVTNLKPEQLGAFATELRKLGAKI